MSRGRSITTDLPMPSGMKREPASLAGHRTPARRDRGQPRSEAAGGGSASSAIARRGADQRRIAHVDPLA